MFGEHHAYPAVISHCVFAAFGDALLIRTVPGSRLSRSASGRRRRCSRSIWVRWREAALRPQTAPLLLLQVKWAEVSLWETKLPGAKLLNTSHHILHGPVEHVIILVALSVEELLEKPLHGTIEMHRGWCGWAHARILAF